MIHAIGLVLKFSLLNYVNIIHRYKENATKMFLLIESAQKMPSKGHKREKCEKVRYKDRLRTIF